MKIKIVPFIILLCFSLNVKAQDPIFTQYFMVPETLNPGFTGFLETTKAGILHRTQWPDLNFRVDTDFGFVNTWLENANSGIGVSILNHREKFTNYNFTQVNLNYAYRVQITDDWFFRPAIEVGFGNKS
jgi:type IX secretion system PorP/SprF family membrane protein